jgi:hypothetical protein
LKGTAAEVTEEARSKFEETLTKTAFLSYYISMYNSVSEEFRMNHGEVTVDEIFDFVQDLKHEAHQYVPHITRSDIALSFSILRSVGICKDGRF